MAVDPVKPNIFDRISHFFTKTFYSKDMKKHQSKLDALHKKESPGQWDDFVSSSKNKDFVKAVMKDPRSSDKLKMHTSNMHSLQTGKKLDTVKGSTSSYNLVDIGNGNIGCTCRDWRFKGSVTPGYQCKHIKEYMRKQL